MEIKKMQLKWMRLFQKFKFVILIVAVGVILMMIPADKDSKESSQQPTPSVSEKSLNDELAEILSKIDGAGDVRVLLTVSAGEQTLYQTDDEVSVDENSSNTKIKTVIVTNSEKSQVGLIKQINPPQYLGAVILCEGADSPSVRLAVLDAVSKATGLGSDKISILKMK